MGFGPCKLVGGGGGAYGSVLVCVCKSTLFTLTSRLTEKKTQLGVLNAIIA